MTSLSRPVLATLLLTVVLAAAGAQISVVGSMTHIAKPAPGTEYTGAIVVRNDGDTARSVRILQTDYQFSSDGRVFYDEPGSHIRSNAPWITPAARAVTVPAKSEIPVGYVVRVPDRELTGTYWSVMIVETEPGDASPDGGTAVGVRHLMRFAVQIVSEFPGGTGALAVADASLDRAAGDATLTLTIANTGTRMLRAGVSLELYARTGEALGPFEADARRLYPGSSLAFAVPLDSVGPGDYRALAIIDAGDDVFATQYALEIK